MLKILQARLQQYGNQELPDVQAGFRISRGTRGQIVNIYWITEKAKKFQKNIYFWTLVHCWQEFKSLKPLWEWLLKTLVSQNIKTEQSMIHQFYFWVCMQRKCTYTCRHICIPILIAPLFAVSETGKKLCPLTNKWIKKMWLRRYVIHIRRNITQP